MSVESESPVHICLSPCAVPLDLILLQKVPQQGMWESARILSPSTRQFHSHFVSTTLSVTDRPVELSLWSQIKLTFAIPKEVENRNWKMRKFGFYDNWTFWALKKKNHTYWHPNHNFSRIALKDLNIKLAAAAFTSVSSWGGSESSKNKPGINDRHRTALVAFCKLSLVIGNC